MPLVDGDLALHPWVDGAEVEQLRALVGRHLEAERLLAGSDERGVAQDRLAEPRVDVERAALGDRGAVVDDEHAGRSLLVVRIDLVGGEQLLLDAALELLGQEPLLDERDRVRILRLGPVDQLDGRAALDSRVALLEALIVHDELARLDDDASDDADLVLRHGSGRGGERQRRQADGRDGGGGHGETTMHEVESSVDVSEPPASLRALLADANLKRRTPSRHPPYRRSWTIRQDDWSSIEPSRFGMLGRRSSVGHVLYSHSR